MKTIYKYELEITDEQTLQLPLGAQLLCVNVQLGKICLWALVDTERVTEQRIIQICGTGNPIVLPGGKLKYIGTAHHDVGMFLVWHVFERVSITS